mmetsp:Transcript_29251/g.47508  ORF Transcript_29251/g.47508 Transcript_29251/m.47508 type:complete len:486 (+) Transcript_29251:525-1982(+)
MGDLGTSPQVQDRGRKRAREDQRRKACQEGDDVRPRGQAPTWRLDTNDGKEPVHQVQPALDLREPAVHPHAQVAQAKPAVPHARVPQAGGGWQARAVPIRHLVRQRRRRGQLHDRNVQCQSCQPNHEGSYALLACKGAADPQVQVPRQIGGRVAQEAGVLEVRLQAWLDGGAAHRVRVSHDRLQQRARRRLPRMAKGHPRHARIGPVASILRREWTVQNTLPRLPHQQAVQETSSRGLCRLVRIRVRRCGRRRRRWYDSAQASGHVALCVTETHGLRPHPTPYAQKDPTHKRNRHREAGADPSACAGRYQFGQRGERSGDRAEARSCPRHPGRYLRRFDRFRCAERVHFHKKRDKYHRQMASAYEEGGHAAWKIAWRIINVLSTTQLRVLSLRYRSPSSPLSLILQRVYIYFLPQFFFPSKFKATNPSIEHNTTSHHLPESVHRHIKQDPLRPLNQIHNYLLPKPLSQTQDNIRCSTSIPSLHHS